MRNEVSLLLVVVATASVSACRGPAVPVRGGAQASEMATPTAAPEVAVTVSPASISLAAGQSVIFTASVAGSVDTGVTWAVQRPSECGSITQLGVYTAPQRAGPCHVVATSHADPTRTAVASATVLPATPPASTLQVRGRRLLDTCGNPLALRGVEYPSWSSSLHELSSFADEIAATGANGVRIMPSLSIAAPGSPPDLALLDRFFDRLAANRLVFNWSLNAVPNGWTDLQWWAQSGVKSLVEKYKKWIMIDASQEFEGGDRVAWRTAVLKRIEFFRTQGYTVPLNVMLPSSGRDLAAALEIGRSGKPVGKEIFDADPLKKTIIGWQAYWFEEGHPEWSGGWKYQDWQGMTLEQAFAACARQSFPIQAGIEYYTENAPNGPHMDYMGAITFAHENSIGWLWWSYEPGDENHLFTLANHGNHRTPHVAQDGEPFGDNVMNAHPHGLHSAVRACGL